MTTILAGTSETGKPGSAVRVGGQGEIHKRGIEIAAVVVAPFYIAELMTAEGQDARRVALDELGARVERERAAGVRHG